jgi:hypothetical protein
MSSPDAYVPSEEWPVVRRLFGRNEQRKVKVHRGPEWLSREWFEEWLAASPGRFERVTSGPLADETELRSMLAEERQLGITVRVIDIVSWLVILLRCHRRHEEADALLSEFIPDPATKKAVKQMTLFD